METKIVELISQLKDDTSLRSSLVGSSHLIDDAGLDSLELINLILLVEAELGVTVDFDSLNIDHLSSISNFASYVHSLTITPPVA